MEEGFYTKGGEALAQVAQRGGGCPVLGVIRSQVGWSSGHPDVALGVIIH